MPHNSAATSGGRSSPMSMLCCKAGATVRRRVEEHNDRDKFISALEARTRERHCGSSAGVLRGYLWNIGGPATLLAKPAGERFLYRFSRSIVHILPCCATGNGSAMVSQSAQDSRSLHAL